jgi:hypothetical protein
MAKQGQKLGPVLITALKAVVKAHGVRAAARTLGVDRATARKYGKPKGAK